MCFWHLMMIKLLFLLIFTMIGVGFFMYLERKFMGLIHFRLGPNKVLFKGLFQFIFDLIKLFIKDFTVLFMMVKMVYYLFPIFLLINMFFMWVLLPYSYSVFNLKMSMFFFLILLLMKIFFLVILVWSFNSIYSFISLLRMVAQMISYDMISILVFIIFFYAYKMVKFEMFVNFNCLNFLMSLLILLFWFISVLVELIRLPFDFYEGESELVSGFNIELGSLYFLILVLVEYMDMIYMMILTLMIFFFNMIYSMWFYFILLFKIYILIWFRLFLIRYRYDKMMFMFWKIMFPLLMYLFILIYFLVFI